MPGENGHSDKREAPSHPEDKPRFKIPPVRVPADRCPSVTSAGETVYLHAGEWVEVLPIPDYHALLALRRVARADDEAAYSEFCERLAGRVTAWSFTDLAGEPLPQPWRNPAAIRDLAPAEQLWLAQVMEAGGEEERKNGSGPSVDTSTPTARSRRRR